MKTMRDIPKKDSIILSSAVVGGAGLMLPPTQSIPEGMGAIVLYVPAEHIAGKTVIEIQRDIGLPWHVEGGQAMWFEGNNDEA